VTVSDLELLLDTTPSPNTLLRPQFYKMGLYRFCAGFHTQFLSGGSAEEVVPSVWVGNKYAAESVNYLQERGITHLLNCAGGERSGVESYVYRGSGSVRPDLAKLECNHIKYKPLTLRDVPGENIKEVFDEAVDWIATALEEGGKILVNCFVGSSRSATVVMAFLIKHRQLTLPQAVVTVKTKRDVRPNVGFLQQLIEYEHLLSHEEHQ